MAGELSDVINQSVNDVIQSCQQTTLGLESSQVVLRETLIQLSQKINNLRGIIQLSENTKINQAVALLDRYAQRMNALEGRISNVSSRVIMLENKLNN